jgi:hypothetical protein
MSSPPPNPSQRESLPENTNSALDNAQDGSAQDDATEHNTRAARSLSANSIFAKSIVVDSLVIGSIVANSIVANSIVANSIVANSISADLISAASVSANGNGGSSRDHNTQSNVAQSRNSPGGVPVNAEARSNGQRVLVLRPQQTGTAETNTSQVEVAGHNPNGQNGSSQGHNARDDTAHGDATDGNTSPDSATATMDAVIALNRAMARDIHETHMAHSTGKSRAAATQTPARVEQVDAYTQTEKTYTQTYTQTEEDMLQARPATCAHCGMNTGADAVTHDAVTQANIDWIVARIPADTPVANALPAAKALQDRLAQAQARLAQARDTNARLNRPAQARPVALIPGADRTGTPTAAGETAAAPPGEVEGEAAASGEVQGEAATMGEVQGEAAASGEIEGEASTSITAAATRTSVPADDATLIDLAQARPAQARANTTVPIPGTDTTGTSTAAGETAAPPGEAEGEASTSITAAARSSVPADNATLIDLALAGLARVRDTTAAPISGADTTTGTPTVAGETAAPPGEAGGEASTGITAASAGPSVPADGATIIDLDTLVDLVQAELARARDTTAVRIPGADTTGTPTAGETQTAAPAEVEGEAAASGNTEGEAAASGEVEGEAAGSGEVEGEAAGSGEVEGEAATSGEAGGEAAASGEIEGEASSSIAIPAAARPSVAMARALEIAHCVIIPVLKQNTDSRAEFIFPCLGNRNGNRQPGRGWTEREEGEVAAWLARSLLQSKENRHNSEMSCAVQRAPAAHLSVTWEYIKEDEIVKYLVDLIGNIPNKGLTTSDIKAPSTMNIKNWLRLVRGMNILRRFLFSQPLGGDLICRESSSAPHPLFPSGSRRDQC